MGMKDGPQRQQHAKNFENREAIRRTWGAQGLLNGVKIRTLFNLGRSSETSEKVDLEARTFKDIIQSSFTDTYKNLIFKTLMGLKYAFHSCSSSDYFVFVDDDAYVSVVNTLKALPKRSDTIFYSGNIIWKPSVFRNPFKKWYISIKEYPFNEYPNFVSGTFTMLTKYTLQLFWLGTFYTKPFQFDDVFLGIIAYKLRIPVTVNIDCFNEMLEYKGPESYKSVIVMHGYESCREMEKVWLECREAGYS
uniref:Hexosyltransferase n=1 Tax=Megaselia scalaris TaxID=36166 RepID=T1GIZ3_MEGSC